MQQPKWIIPEQLASFNNDTFRAELSPRRVAPDGNGAHKIVTPEEAEALESKFQDDWKAECAKIADQIAAAVTREEKVALEHAVKPDKTKYVFVDNQARHFPKTWKLYEYRETDDIVGEMDANGKVTPVLDDSGNEVKVWKFIRVGEVNTILEALEYVPEVS